MMDTAKLLQQLFVIEDDEARRDLLDEHRPLETIFFQQLKERVRNKVEEDSEAALWMTDVGLEAAQMAVEKEGVAYAWWARGNALLFLGRYEDCLSAYATALSTLAGLNRPQEIAQLQTNCMLPLMWTGRHQEASEMGQSALEVLDAQEQNISVANLLLNLALCAQHQGDYPTALARTRRAAQIFTQLGQAVQAARCQVTQSIALEYLDRFAEAQMLLEEALDVFAAHGARVPWARAGLNLGILHARLTDHQTGLSWLARSREAFLDAGIEVDAAIVDLYRARIFRDLNLLPEATALGEELIATFTRLEMPRQVARAASLLGQAYMRRGRADQAWEQFQHARRIFRAQEDKVEIARIDLWRARLLQTMGRPGAALHLASEVAEVLDVNYHPLRHAEAHCIIAACCQDLGRIEEAQLAYQVAWEAGSHPTDTTEPLPGLAYRIAYARGTIAEAAGERALARGEYERAVNYLTKIAQGMGLDDLRGGYLADKRPVYEAAMRLALEEGRVTDGFRISELARAGALRDVLAGSALMTNADDQDAEDSRKKHLKDRWAWRASRLHHPIDLMAEADEEILVSEDRPALLSELSRLERELRWTYRRHRLSDLRFAVSEQGDVLDFDGIRRRLPDDGALLAFDHVDDRLLAFVITPQTADLVRLCSLEQLRWEATGLAHALEEIHLFDEPSDVRLLEEDLREDLQALHEAVLAEPLARVGTEVRRLLIVPSDVLHTLPLEALHDGQRHLVERYSVSYLPSASLLGALPQDRQASAGCPLVMAHSCDGRLPLARKEAEQVARALARSKAVEPRLLREEQATESALRGHADDSGLLHVAAHGVFRNDAPLFSSLHLEDGPLTVNEIYELNLSQAALVVLSACQTGLGQGRGGEMLGLTHAFFLAGAPTLVVSRWRVEDEITAQIMEDFYAALVRGEPTAEALQEAQLNVLASYPHAGHWAAFAVWGRGFEAIL
jgi:tetratricopeptide (TPR) repeat protein